MIEAKQLKRPNVRGTVILTSFLAFLLILSGYILLSLPVALIKASELDSYRIEAYIRLGFGVLLFVDAVLVATYRRIGLLIGLAAYVPLIIFYASLMLRTRAIDLLGLMSMIFMIAAIYYLFRYLTHEPEKQFFT